MDEQSPYPTKSRYGLLDLIAKLDIIDRIEGWVSTFLNADWKGAKKQGAWGVASEVGRCAVRSNTHLIETGRCGWNGPQMKRYLEHYGVKIFDRGCTRQGLCFRVKARQARWTEHLLWRVGIPVLNAPADPNAHLAWYKYQGQRPTPWQGQAPERQTPIDGVLDRISKMVDAAIEYVTER